MGWLADRSSRKTLVQINALGIATLTALMWGWSAWPYWFMLLMAAGFGVFQFTLYGLASGLANESIDSDRRVGLTAIFLMTYGVGACLGPIFAGALMRFAGAGMLYVFSTTCALILFLFLRTSRQAVKH